MLVHVATLLILSWKWFYVVINGGRVTVYIGEGNVKNADGRGGSLHVPRR